MMIAMIILTIILMVIIGVIVFANDDFSNGMILGIALLLVMLICLITIGINIIVPTPTAMDVYQGKTTLEITYIDGIPVDSVVIFKD